MRRRERLNRDGRFSPRRMGRGVPLRSAWGGWSFLRGFIISVFRRRLLGAFPGRQGSGGTVEAKGKARCWPSEELAERPASRRLVTERGMAVRFLVVYSLI